MAPTFTTIKLFSSFAVVKFSNSLTIRRGYAAAASRGVVSCMSNTKMAQKSEKEKVCNEVCDWWMPDPVTGNYKPHNINEVDVAELRAKLLPRKFNNSSS